jgi:hypothetical protein
MQSVRLRCLRTGCLGNSFDDEAVFRGTMEFEDLVPDLSKVPEIVLTV